MPRPSRNIDKILIKTGLELLPETGVSGLNVRELAKRAGVNLGMFHYYFKNKPNFVRSLLQEAYEQMFANLERSLDPALPPKENLRGALITVGRFSRDHHRLLMAILTDLKQGDEVVTQFVKQNFPRHVGILMGLIKGSQKDGTILDVPLPEILVFLMTSIGVANLVVGLAREETRQVPDEVRRAAAMLHSDAAIQRRVDMALKGVSP